MKSPLLLIPCFLGLGCAHSNIEGTNIPATAENEAIYATIKEMEEALETRDVDRLFRVISRQYFEDMGTATTADDFSYEQLREQLAGRTLAATEEIHLDMDIYEILVDGNRAIVDIRYNSRARIDLPSGDVWDNHREFNRIELALENDQWMIVSGI